MTKLKKCTVSILLLLLGFSFSTLNAQINTKGAREDDNIIPTGHSFGLVIGISQYTNLPKLQYADKDAEYFYNLLKQISPREDSNNLALFTNKDVTRDAVTDKLYDITERVKPGDKVFIYFSGHGDLEQLIQTDNCLLLLGDSPSKNYLRKSSSYLDINLFKQFFQSWASKNAKIIFVCDACHSGSLIGGETGRKNTLLSLQESWKNEIKLLSCQPGELSLEGGQWGGGRGLFSYYLGLGLKGLAHNNNKGNGITLFELDNFLRQQVSNSSDQAQIPVAQGDMKFVINTVSAPLLAAAKKELSKNNSEGLYASNLRGGENDILDLIKDSVGRATYLAFKKQLHSNNLLEPEGASAHYYLEQFISTHGNRIVKNNMTIELIDALQYSYDQLLDLVYLDEYAKVGIFEKLKIEKELTSALKLAGNNKAIADKINSKLLFFKACEVTIDIMHGSISYANTEKLNNGIDFLKKAIALDLMSPNLYLKMGDYLLYTNRFAEAVKTYLHYQQLLPNDEHSYNKLGLAFMASQQYDEATAAFKKSLQINPGYSTAFDNLKIAMKQKK